MALKSYGPLTLTGLAQQLTDFFTTDKSRGGKEDFAPVQVVLQGDAANANPIFVGSDNTVSGTVYGGRIEKAAAGVPAAPLVLGPLSAGVVRLSDVWVFGTAGEKIRALVVYP